MTSASSRFEVMHQVTATKAIDSRSQDQMGRISGASLGRGTGLVRGRGGFEQGQQCGPGIDPNRAPSARRTEPTRPPLSSFIPMQT